MPSLLLLRGDLTGQEVDAVVNAANGGLMGGGGVDGAIHRRGGPAILEACRELRRTSLPEGLPTGQAVATTGGDLPARWVIHTVGPVYARDPDPAAALAACHANALRVADELGARTVAFPAISTGVFGYPIREAAGVARPIQTNPQQQHRPPGYAIQAKSHNAVAAAVSQGRADW